MGTVFTRRFEADHIGTQVPVKLMHLEGLYELFISKFVSVHSTLHLENDDVPLAVLWSMQIMDSIATPLCFETDELHYLFLFFPGLY